MSGGGFAGMAVFRAFSRTARGCERISRFYPYREMRAEYAHTYKPKPKDPLASSRSDEKHLNIRVLIPEFVVRVVR
jgi:hypothetical protein